MNTFCYLLILSAISTDTVRVSIRGSVEPGASVERTIPAAGEASTYAIVVSIDRPGSLKRGVPVAVSVKSADFDLKKTLHVGDPDIAWLVKRKSGDLATVTIAADSNLIGSTSYTIESVNVGGSASDGVAFESEPNDRAETANAIPLGAAVYGLADDRAYFPLGEKTTEAERTAGQDWFTFEYNSDQTRLAYFALDFIDRDVPPDVKIYKLVDGAVVEWLEGIDPPSRDRERPPRPGANKFTTRSLTKGRYYILVDACQPEYRLTTKLLDPPPYLTKERADRASDAEIAAAARKAIRAALDYQLLAGDSWHADTPRKGHPLDRIANPHHETATCIACHPTHFTTQSTLAAVRAGYKIEEPFALSFLTDRLANNPVPFPGSNGALWARVIPAPANVMGRLSTILIDQENLITHAPRSNLHQGIGEFLKLYYDGRKTIPPDESNGNNPVSRYKVATDAWRQLSELVRRTGNSRYASTRDLVAKLLRDGKPANLRDLAAQTIGLCTVDRSTNSDLIASNVKRIRELRRDDGLWPIVFDRSAQGSVMQTGECLYALKLAGIDENDPAVIESIKSLLIAQKPFGGWFDLHPYEQFRTPFRETQWSLIALSSFYPEINAIERNKTETVIERKSETEKRANRPSDRRGDDREGRGGPLGARPETLVGADNDSRRIALLDRIWDKVDPDLNRELVAALESADPLVRYAACRALGRVGGASNAAALAIRLGDVSKVVRRAAAEALRAIGNRASAAHPPGETEDQRILTKTIADALQSHDDRVRRGATRIFAAHFRDLSQETELIHSLIERLADSDPVVATQAVKGLWRAWYWRGEIEIRDAIENALIAKLAEDVDPRVRRNLVEALYIIGDDNIRYLYGNWIPSLADQADRDRARGAQRSTVNRLGEKYIKAIETGNARTREGVLRAISEFPERPVLGGRVGNDLEPPLFYDETVPRMAAAIIRQMSDPDPTIRRLALESLVSLRGSRDRQVALAVLARSADPDSTVRDWAKTMSKEFPLAIDRGKTTETIDAIVDSMIESPIADARAAAVSITGTIGPLDDRDRDLKNHEIIKKCLSDPAAEVRAAALRAIAAFPTSLADPACRSAVTRALTDDDVSARVAAVRIAIDHREVVAESALRRALEDPTPRHRIALLDMILKTSSYASDPRFLGMISDTLVEGDLGAREKALQLIQRRPKLVANPAIADGLRTLSKSDNRRQSELAASLLATLGRSSATNGRSAELDLAYFEARVLPIFAKMGEDGQNCVGCHRSHTILKLIPPDKSGRWNPDAVRANYRSALRVVDLADPQQSLLLGKPTWEAAEEAEAQKDHSLKAHAGGVRFESANSREYQAILDWINGARLDDKPRPNTKHE